jgi:hypothetical protein
MSAHIKELKEEVPDYSTIWWRVVRVKIKELNPEVNPEDIITIAIDSTGIKKVTNRGEWIRNKWNRRKRRGFIKIHLAVDDIRTKHIVSMKVTREDVSDSRMLKPLVQQLVASSSSIIIVIIRINKVIADGAYDSNNNFRYLTQIGIEPVIKVRKNSSTNTNGCMARKLVVLEQHRNIKRWKKRHGYGMRWIAESVFSSIKRTFGEYVTSIKWNNIVNELLLKASLQCIRK